MSETQYSRDIIREKMVVADGEHYVLPRISSEKTLRKAAENLKRVLTVTHGIPDGNAEELMEHEKSHAQKYLERMGLKNGITPSGAFGYRTLFGRVRKVSFSFEWDGIDYDDLLHIGCAPSDMGSPKCGRRDVEMTRKVLRAKRKGVPFEDFRRSLS